MTQIICIFLTLCSLSIQVDKEKLAWSPDRKLSWEDFRGKPEAGNGFVASTNSGVSFSFSYRVSNGKLELDYSVASNFYPELSWFLKGEVTDYILQHEQTHFDISELHARKLRERMATTEFSTNPREKINEIYTENEMQRKAMQHQFDKDSDHSKNPEEEYRWRAYVAEELARYDSWE